MTGVSDPNTRLKVWTLKKLFNPGFYSYKFKLGDSWVLDPYREIRLINGHENHWLNLEDPLAFDFLELCSGELASPSVTVNCFDHEDFSTLLLYGHSMNTIGNRIFILGGKIKDSVTNNIYVLEFNPLRLSEIEMTDRNGPAFIAFHKTISYGEKLIVYGGHNDHNVSDSYHTYSTLNNLWTTYKVTNPLLRELYSAVYKRNTSRIYVFGGYFCSADSECEMHFNDLHVLYLNLMTFQRLEARNPPPPRYHHSAVLINWTMFVFGGCRKDGVSKVCYNDLQRINLFDHDELVWEEIEPRGARPAKRYGHICVTLGTKLIIHGGQGEGVFPPIYGDMWIFELLNSTWTRLNYENIEEGAVCRSLHAGTLFNDSLVVFGGRSEGKNKSANRLFIFKFDLKKEL